MKRVFSSPSLIEVTQLKDVLEQSGIACLIRNEISSGLAGEIPMTESTPELWVEDDSNLATALQAKQDWQARQKAPGSEWVCPACGEASEPQFTSCWNCGASKS